MADRAHADPQQASHTDLLRYLQLGVQQLAQPRIYRWHYMHVVVTLTNTPLTVQINLAGHGEAVYQGQTYAEACAQAINSIGIPTQVPADVRGVLDALGYHGWELASYSYDQSNHYAVLKRPLP